MRLSRRVLTRGQSRLVWGGATALLFLIVLGGRWAAIGQFGRTLPDADQWDDEGVQTLEPWYGGSFSPATLFRPINEHRVVLTKLVNLALTVANGQWDQRLEMTVNALLAAAFAAGVFRICRRWLPATGQLALFVLIGAAVGSPLNWENLLQGYHSQQFFLLDLSLVTLVWLPFAPVGSGRWWLGAVASGLALLSMASGFFAAAVAAVLVLRQAVRGSRSWGSAAPVLALGAGWSALGWFTRNTGAFQAPLRAHSVADLVGSAAQQLAWPASGRQWEWLAVILWSPWCLLAAGWLRPRRAVGEPPPALLVGLGAWVLLQVGACAYSRGHDAGPPVSRYMDNLLLGALVNVTALGWLVRAEGAVPVWWRRLGATLWLATFAVSLAVMARFVVRTELPRIRQRNERAESNTRHYLATGDRRWLSDWNIPYPNADVLIDRLNSPVLRRLLPIDGRGPVKMGPLSDWAWCCLRQGRLLAGVAWAAVAALGLIAGFRLRRTDPRASG